MTGSLARRFGCTEGQIYTIVTATLVATILAWSGISPLPPVEGGFLPVAAAPQPPATSVRAPASVPAPAAAALAPPSGATFGTGGGGPSPSQFNQTDGDSSPSPTVFAVIGDPGAPAGVAVGPDGRVYVVTDNGGQRGVPGASHVFGFSAEGERVADIAVSGQLDGHIRGLTGVAVALDGTLAALDASTSRVLRVDIAARTSRVLATIPNASPCLLPLAVTTCEPGMADRAPLLVADAFDGAGNLYVADAGQATIWKVASGGAVSPWYQADDLGTDAPAGLTLDGAGNAYVTAQAGLFKIARNADGTAGARSTVVSFAAADGAAAVAVSPSGTAYVALAKRNTIVAIDAGVAMPVPTEGSPVPLDGPAGLALSGDRLLVTNQAPEGGRGRWAVLSVPALR